MRRYALAVVGASWGGLDALGTLLRGLPARFALPVAMVQHRGRDSRNLLRDLLQSESALPVLDVEDKEPMRPGHVYLAPADYHLLVEDDHFSLSVDPPVRYSRPSIDVLFVSAAEALGPAVVGVVLTGANDDGARGLRVIVDRGGYGIVQSAATAQCAVMPASALRRVPEAEVLDLLAIAPRLVELAALEVPGGVPS